MKEGLLAGVVSIFLGILAIFIGWTIVGGLGLGIPALVLAMRSYRKGHRLLGVFGIIFSCVGIIEGLAIAGIVGFLSILTMPTRIEVTTTPTVKVETVTKTLTVTVKETITKTLERIAPTIATTETIKSEYQIFKWRLLWEKRLNDTIDQIKMSPSGKFVSIIARSIIEGPQLLFFSRDGNVTYSVRDGITYYTKLLSISDEGESWILDSKFQKDSAMKELAIVKGGKAIWLVDFHKILPYPANVLSISQDGKYVVALYLGWIYYLHRANDSLVVMWKFKPAEIQYTEYQFKTAISTDNKYICVIGNKWLALLDNRGNLLWEKDISRYGQYWLRPYFVSDTTHLIGIPGTPTSVTGIPDNLILIFDLEGQLIREIHIREYLKSSPTPIIVNNLIIWVSQRDRTEVLHVYNWDGKLVYTFKPKGDKIIAIASSLDGKYIAISDDALRVYLLERED